MVRPYCILFLYSNITIEHFLEERKWIEDFAKLDDYDILSAIKVWTTHLMPSFPGFAKAWLTGIFTKSKFRMNHSIPEYVSSLKDKTAAQFHVKEEEIDYFLVEGTVTNNAYNPEHDRIRILFRNNELIDLSEASDQLNISVLSTPVNKYLLCYPKNLIN